MKKSTILIITIVITIIGMSRINAQTKGTFTDKRNNKVYKTVKIGSQIWMAENLAYKTKYGCWTYRNKPENVRYGYLYNWKTAKEVCPIGWRLPTDADWKQLEMQLGMTQIEADKRGKRGTNQGLQLKADTDWKKVKSGTNKSGFSALPAGYCKNHGLGSTGIRLNTHLWSASSINSSVAWIRFLHFKRDGISRITGYKVDGYSVRCIKE